MSGLRALRLVAGCGCLLAGLAAAAERPRVLVLKSSGLAAYHAVVAGFAAEARVDVVDLTLGQGGEGAAALLKQEVTNRPALVLAVGPAAANAARRAFTEVPVVFCMVPYFEKYGLEGPNLTGIALTSDLTSELTALKAALPAASRVGILLDPRYSSKLAESVAGLAGDKGLTVVPVELDNPAELERVLRSTKGKLDAMLMIADKTVGSAPVVRRLISFCAEEKLALLALSASQVKEGALLALSPSPVDIGQQAGRLANRILFEKVDPGALQVARPEQLDLAINLGTARKLGPGSEVALELLKFAAHQGYPVKVFE